MNIPDLPTVWRDRADLLRRHGAREAATAVKTLADELETALRATADVVLTIAEASTESGYSPDHLRHLLAASKIPNAGRRGAPRVRRKDLPAKATAATRRDYDPRAEAAAICRASAVAPKRLTG